MNNHQYSRGCSYTYRRSVQRDMAMENRSRENCAKAERSMECPPGENCSRKDHSMEKPLAMGYVPMQRWSQPLPLAKGLQTGTIFKDLHKPFCGKGGACR